MDYGVKPGFTEVVKIWIVLCSRRTKEGNIFFSFFLYPVGLVFCCLILIDFCIGQYAVGGNPLMATISGSKFSIF